MKFLLKKRWGGVLLAGVLVAHVQAALPSKVESSLVDEIQTSQQRLAKTQRELTDKRARLGKKLHQLKNSLRELRKQTAVSRRLADERTLSLEKLRKRLSTWRDQGRYQHNLLITEHQKLAHGSERKLPVRKKFSAGLTWLQGRLAGMQPALYPHWHKASMVNVAGELVDSSQLSVGPVQWYWQADSKRAGLLSSSDEQPVAQVAMELTGDQRDGVAKLFNTGEGAPGFDPTLNRVLTLSRSHESLLKHLNKGGVWVLPILAFAVFALFIALGKSLQLWRLPKLLPALPERTEKLAAADDTAALNAFIAKTAGAQRDMLAITQASTSSQQRDDRLFACLLEHKHKLEYWLGAIAITASVAPLLGLLGTVSGMIKTFKMMTLFGAGDPTVVSGGISEALITTELGLVVAIPALLLHALLQRWVKSYYSSLENCAIKFSQIQLGAEGEH